MSEESEPDAGQRILDHYRATGQVSAAGGEELMRSRFAAFGALSRAIRAQDQEAAREAAAYLLQTWAPENRPGLSELLPEGDSAAVAAEAAVTWTKLTVLDVVQGRDRAEVEFVAGFVPPGAPRQRLHERSVFRKEADGRWVYVDGEVRP